MMGRIIIGGMLVFALIVGVAMYYLQVYAFYAPVTAPRVQLVNLNTGAPEDVAYAAFDGIDSDSSPVRYRACFTLDMSLAALTETYVMADEAVPLLAPRWFDCFDAAQIGADLEAGVALPFLGQKDVTYGIDRLVAVYPDGRAYAWNQINVCGEVVFDGDPVPEGCPPVPESLQ